MSDLEAAVDLLNACSKHLSGRPMVDIDYLRQDWSTPSFNLESDSICILTDTGDLVGYGEIRDSAPHIVVWSFGRVHPRYRKRGLEDFIMAWQEDRARGAGELAPREARVTLQQMVRNGDKDAISILETHGFAAVRHFHKMLIELSAPLPSHKLPQGIAVRTFKRDEDLPAVIHADQEAFRDHWGFVSRPFEEELATW
jgi:mycothiol synthase